MGRKNAFWGVALIVIGLLILMSKLYNFNLDMGYYWPLFVLVPGLLFEFGYFISGRNAGVLVPGGILTTIGLLFFFETFTGWSFADHTWPIYPLAVAIGLFQLYLFGGRKNGLLVPVFILTAVSAIAFASMFLSDFLPWLNSSIIFPAFLVLLGIYILFFSRRR